LSNATRAKLVLVVIKIINAEGYSKTLT
jgi:hypothetical protein